MGKRLRTVVIAEDHRGGFGGVFDDVEGFDAVLEERKGDMLVEVFGGDLPWREGWMKMVFTNSISRQ